MPRCCAAPNSFGPTNGRRSLDKLQRKHPGFSRKETALVSKGLRQFFNAYLKSGRQQVSMPSEVVDQLWHEFILYTQAYKTSAGKLSAASCTIRRRP